MITLVNTCVFSVTQNRTLLTWTILKVSDEEQTVGEFYNNAVIARLPSIDTELLSAAVGTEKDDLDNVDLNLPVVPVINSFGHFLKFAVESANNGDSMSTAQVTSSDAAAATADLFFIESVRERNKKDKLCNSIIHFFKSRNAFVKESEVHLTKKLVLLLRDIFWHIDGHHHVFEQRAIAIPSVFNEFNRFNTSELSKHRKRLTGNISCDQLQEFALGLTTVLQENYWDREHWSVIKPYFLILSQSLDNYADYLCQKNKRMKINHRSPTPVRELSANLKVKFIAPSVNTSSLLQPVEDSLSEKSPYEYVFITPLLYLLILPRNTEV